MGGPPWEAWGSVPVAPQTTAGSATAGGAARAAVGGAAHGPSMSPALLALSSVDESFREQINLLRQAAARHRELLEKARVPADDASCRAGFGGASPLLTA